jgi:AraC-like DNA-binding protein
MPLINHFNKNNLFIFLIFLFISNKKLCSQNNFEENINREKAAYFSNRNNDSLLFYARKMQKSKTPCNSYLGLIKESLFLYKKGNYSESEKIAKSVFSELIYKNKRCDIRNKVNILNRLFWIKRKQHKYTEAYNYVLIADSITNTLKKDLYYFKSKSSIKTNKALIKSELNLYNESNKILAEIINDFEKADIYKLQKATNNFLLQKASIFNMMGNNYLNLYDESLNEKHIDSADIFYLKAHLESKRVNPPLKDSDMYYNLRGVKLDLRRKKYREALKKIQNLSNETTEASKSHSIYFKAIIYNKLNQIDSSLCYSYKFIALKEKIKNKVQLIEMYEILSNVYNAKNNIDSALKYSNLNIKSLERIKKENNKVFVKIYQDDFNNAIAFNNKIVSNQSKSKNQFIIIISILIVFISSLLYFLKKKKVISSKKKYNISKTLKKELLLGFEELESSKDFLRQDFSIQFFAKKLNTNTSYLSYTINRVKKKSFKQYLAGLRINYLLKILKEEKRFRNYTIQSLAEEVGYTNASAFTRAFKKHKRISPSEFIKSLK